MSVFATLDPVRRKLALEKAQQHVQDVRARAAEELSRITQEAQKRTRGSSLVSSLPPVFIPYLAPKRYKGAHGGRGSAKSWSFATMALYRAQSKKGTRIVCIREVQKSLEQSVKRLLEDLIQRHNLGAEFKVLNTHIETPGDGVIIFQGMQNHTAESIKSLEGYDIAWVEEAQAFSERSLTLLRPTLRKEDSEIWFTWNPRHATDPVDRFLRGEKVPPNSIVRQVNYTDNPHLPEVLRTEMEWDKSRDYEKYEHIWLGEHEKHSEARVFKNWTVEFFETPIDASFLFGGDWGFAVDPSVLLRGFIQPEQPKRLYLDAEAYQVGCEIDDTPALFDTIGSGMARNWPITTDSARPETISHMQRHGYPRVVGAKKGPNSVQEGIAFLKNYDIIIHPRCIHTVDEFTHYSFKVHPLTGMVLPVLSDKKNHVIDSARYMVEPLREPVEEEGFCAW